MPHISPKQIDTKVLKKLYELFFATVTSRRQTRKQQQAFFNELLTTTEKIMLGKRLAAIVLLSRGASSYRVGRTLKLSPTTTGKLLERLDRGEFNHIVKLDVKQKKGELAHYIENLLFSSLPPYGKSWWRHLEDK